jgi:hypothetical protein
MPASVNPACSYKNCQNRQLYNQENLVILLFGGLPCADAGRNLVKLDHVRELLSGYMN